MSKLIKTSLLKKFNNTSDIAKITASTKDYCDYRYKQAIKEMDFKEIFASMFYTFVLLFVFFAYLPVKLTRGLILYPLWICQHLLLKRKVIHEVLADNKTIDELNKFAKEIESNSKE